jgi:Ca2+-binding EF-hand superfamily protein
MGCITSRNDISPEETVVMDFETLLGYSTLSPSHLDKIHRKYSYNGKISDNQWKDICYTLNLAPNKIEASQHISNYYDKYRTEDNSFALNELLVLGILLSKGRPGEKAKLLFEVFDENASGGLGLGQIHELLSVMVKVALELNPQVVVKDGVSDVGAQDLMKYFEKLNKGKEVAIEMAEKEILGKDGMVKSMEFVKALSGKMSYFVSPHGIRKYVKLQLPDKSRKL